MSPLLNPKELAQILNVPVKSVYGWTRQNSIPHIRIGRHLRYSLDEVMKHLTDGTRSRAEHCQAQSIWGRPILERSLKTRIERLAETKGVSNGSH